METPMRFKREKTTNLRLEGLQEIIRGKASKEPQFEIPYPRVRAHPGVWSGPSLREERRPEGGGALAGNDC